MIIFIERRNTISQVNTKDIYYGKFVDSQNIIEEEECKVWLTKKSISKIKFKFSIIDYYVPSWFINNRFNVLFHYSVKDIKKIISYYKYDNDYNQDVIKKDILYLENSLDKIINEAYIKNIIE